MVASATPGRSEDVCKGARSLVQGERYVVRSRSLFKRSEINEEEEGMGVTENTKLRAGRRPSAENA